jgi:REP element-mobilizing transposase RayT
MARLARAVAVGIPHHVTQRGNRRQPVFFSDADYAAYMALLAEGCRSAGVAVWAYCLMPNHVYLIFVPSTPDGRRSALGEAEARLQEPNPRLAPADWKSGDRLWLVSMMAPFGHAEMAVKELAETALKGQRFKMHRRRADGTASIEEIEG